MKSISTTARTSRFSDRFTKLYLSELQNAGTLDEFYTPRAITELLTEFINPEPGEKVLDPA